MMLPIVFDAHPECKACKLHEFAKNPGIPTRPAGLLRGEDPVIPRHSKAVLLVGKAPGTEEDSNNRSFVGPVGLYTHRFMLDYCGVGRYADVYLTNAVRCRLPTADMKPNLGMVKTCSGYLHEDVRRLLPHYSEVVLLLTGEDAVKVLGKTIALSNFPQGTRQTLAKSDLSLVTFATFNAGKLLPGRDPACSVAMKEHLRLLCEYLEFGKVPMTIEETFEVDRVSTPPLDGRELAFDIETYGSVEGLPHQNFFNPRKAVHWDKVDRKDLVVSCAMAWRDDNGVLRHRFYDLTNREDRARFVALFQGPPLRLVGMNTPFDVSWLRYWDDDLYQSLSLGRHVLIDLSVFNFLQNDARPEKGLKPLSYVLGTYDYSKEEVSLKRGEKYLGTSDPRFQHYNVVDALATILNLEKLRQHIQDMYGPTTKKLSEPTIQWYSRLMWFVIRMMEHGVRYDQGKLQALLVEWESRLKRVNRTHEKKFGAPVAGKGSGAYKTKLALRAAQELGLASDPRLQRSDITGKVSFNEDNINLFLGMAPHTSPLRKEIKSCKLYKRIEKVLSTYLRPMLGITKDKTSALIDGIAYPSWSIVPSQLSSSSSQGTKQVRVTSKGPATQTQPAVVEATQCSRYPGGCLVHVDGSQIELRVAGGLSHDPVIVKAYTQYGGNLHAATGSLIAGHTITKADKIMYHAGKTLNFLVLFLGGWKVFQETVCRETGILFPKEQCKDIIAAYDRDHKPLRAWQENRIEEAIATGKVELPVFGISRIFRGGRKVIRETYASTIANFPVQSVAALLILSAQIATEDWILSRNSGIITVANTYDEGIYDVPAGERDEFVEAVKSFYRRPPIYDLLVEAGFHPLPLECEVTTQEFSNG